MENCQKAYYIFIVLEIYDENSKSSILCAVLNSDIGYIAIAKCVS